MSNKHISLLTQVFILMVGVTGIEPVTPSMSTKCSPAELYALFKKLLHYTTAFFNDLYLLHQVIFLENKK